MDQPMLSDNEKSGSVCETHQMLDGAFHTPYRLLTENQRDG